jgi:hypothetical protein
MVSPLRIRRTASWAVTTFSLRSLVGTGTAGIWAGENEGGELDFHKDGSVEKKCWS